MDARVLAVIATQPGREAVLAQALASLRPQVTELRVIVHDKTEPPACVREMADEWLCEPDTRGSAAKLHWAQSWSGLYLGCDDDLIYPADYVATTLRWVKRWKGRALVTWYGRTLRPTKTRFEKPLAVWWWQQSTEPGAWINFPYSGVLGFDTRLRVPTHVPGKSLEEEHLAIWAQRRQVPIWLVPHKANPFVDLLKGQDVPALWRAREATGYAQANALVSPYGERHGWRVHRCP